MPFTTRSMNIFLPCFNCYKFNKTAFNILKKCFNIQLFSHCLELRGSLQEKNPALGMYYWTLSCLIWKTDMTTKASSQHASFQFTWCLGGKVARYPSQAQDNYGVSWNVYIFSLVLQNTILNKYWITCYIVMNCNQVINNHFCFLQVDGSFWGAAHWRGGGSSHWATNPEHRPAECWGESGENQRETGILTEEQEP